MTALKIAVKIAMAAVIFIAAPFAVLAVNDVIFDDAVNFELVTADTAATVTITAAGGGQVTNIDAQSNYMDITLDNLSSVTFHTNFNTRFLRITKQSGSNDYAVNPSCPTTTVALTGTGAQVILRLEVFTTDTCPPSSGGNWRITEPVPTNISLKINGGAAETNSGNVTLTLGATDATRMLISNDANFTGISWEDYATSKNWTLLPGLGSRTVYAIFGNNTEFSNTAYAVINVVSQPEPTAPAPTPTPPPPQSPPSAPTPFPVPAPAHEPSPEIIPIPISVSTPVPAPAPKPTAPEIMTPATPKEACGRYLAKYIKFGVANDSGEVKKLQIFMRDYEGFSNLPVTGFFGQKTYGAVKKFQAKYAKDILSPWKISAPTGYVYISTVKKINELYCAKNSALMAH